MRYLAPHFDDIDLWSPQRPARHDLLLHMCLTCHVLGEKRPLSPSTHCGGEREQHL